MLLAFDWTSAFSQLSAGPLPLVSLSAAPLQESAIVWYPETDDKQELVHADGLEKERSIFVSYNIWGSVLSLSIYFANLNNF
ncbi:unnamed protein product [Gongylonema pulchrum]|uniref:Uncharacterized protein n=1 Tax=Gongylonema pulchrum TaxID=637853 RepID=A0A183DRE8_9BILA|nr:unnamed protein product [Gongylonema pulchrum]